MELSDDFNKKNIIDSTNTRITMEIAGLGGSITSAGLHFDLFDHQLGLSALLGFSFVNIDTPQLALYLMFLGKAYWSPFPEDRISPYLGGALIFGYPNNTVMFQFGPMAGIALNLNGTVFRSIFIEFQSYIWIGREYRLANQVTFGVRLF